MNAVFKDDYTKPEEVQDLINRFNKIHSWDLRVHAQKCARDIKLAMKNTEPRSGIRVSVVPADSDLDLGPDSEDDEGEQGQTKEDV
ncbi:hypothetical protein N7G274_008431 [Stereocaulon virgatum]|uniref:Uncharacterized protein n=1 Tax=Stereocaulon virgatum TaxID=373712 RepID=A0ABR4A0W1_9LECA